MICGCDERRKCDSLYIEKQKGLEDKIKELEKEKEEIRVEYQNKLEQLDIPYKNKVQKAIGLINTHKFKDRYDRELLAILEGE